MDSRVDLHLVPAVPHGRIGETKVADASNLLPLVSRLRQDVGLVDLESVGSGRDVALNVNSQEGGQVGIIGRLVVASGLGSGSPCGKHERD